MSIKTKDFKYLHNEHLCKTREEGGTTLNVQKHGSVAEGTVCQLRRMPPCWVNTMRLPVAWLRIVYSPGKQSRSLSTHRTAASSVPAASTGIASPFPAVL